VFLQATKLGLETIIDFIKKNIINDSNIADLYSGCGFYALSIAKFAKKIEAFEGENSMVEIINNNSKNLQLSHKVKGFCRDLFISPLTTQELKKYQTIIINPPRSGAKAQIKQIANCADCQKLIYVSCNPQTFFSDAKIVIERYFKLTKIIAIDQFFLTKHLEVVAVFEKI
jgi:23S rRNA (uracil1939-C5)-methyltransferase